MKRVREFGGGEDANQRDGGEREKKPDVRLSKEAEERRQQVRAGIRKARSVESSRRPGVDLEWGHTRAEAGRMVKLSVKWNVTREH